MNRTVEMKYSADLAILDGPPLTLDVFCHVERLGPTYDKASTYAYFTLNLTGALTDGPPGISKPEILRLLRPWAWLWTELSVRGIKKDSASGKDISVEITGVELLRSGLPAPDDNVLKSFASELITTLGPDSNPQFGNFQWE